MEVLIIVAVIVGVIIAAVRSLGGSTQGGVKKQSSYKYQVKSKIMTEREIIFYEKLNHVAGAKYAIVPQVHLSAFLDHKIKGQSWRGAFSVINGKSVDYLLVNKDTLKPTIAIELDDYTHQSDARIKRDRKVEDIMKNSGMKLVRFSDVHASEDQIFDRLSQTS